MARPRKLPDVSELEKLARSGMTHQQIADYVQATTGEPVTRGAVSAALSRAGKSTDKARYLAVIPWRVKIHHLREYPVRMLRLLGRHEAGIPLSGRESQRLRSWLEMLNTEQVVVAYDPDNHKQGFHYIDEKYGDSPDAPIRIKPIKT